MTTNANVKYVAIICQPGYLPDSDPAFFDTEQEALEYLLDQYEFYRDGLAPDEDEDDDWPDITVDDIDGFIDPNGYMYYVDIVPSELVEDGD